MDIKELEFIRDLCNDIDTLRDDMSVLVSVLIEKEDTGEEIDKILNLNIYQFRNQLDLISKLLYRFKEVVDDKYHSEWDKLKEEMKGVVPF